MIIYNYIYNEKVQQMRIAVCDDDRTIIEQLETYFDSIEDKDLEYEVFFSAEELSRYISKEDDEFDLYILDIEMYEMSGLDLAKSIRQKNTNALVVFMTSHPKYVYDVFEVVTFDFIQKPFTYEKFEKVIHKVEKYLGIVKNKFIFEFQKIILVSDLIRFVDLRNMEENCGYTQMITKNINVI